MATKDYDPKEITIIFDSHIAEGFADGTFVTISRNNPMWNVVSGASGEHARGKTNDRTGTIELTLMQTSLTNDFLSSKMALDELTNAGKFTFSLVDGHGLTRCGSLEMWVKEPPSTEYGKEIGDRMWTLECGDLEMFVGGTV